MATPVTVRTAPTPTRPGSRWRPRRVLRVLHRDIGYLLFFITALYAVSGIAVNHIGDWNPNYKVTRETVTIGTLPRDDLERGDLDAMEAEVVRRLGLDPGSVVGRHRPGPDEFVVFLPEGSEVRLDLRTGVAQIALFEPRPLIYESNVLHLNKIKGAWTYVADAFALLLFFLAASGLFMLKGRTGLGGRGKWLVAIGILIPLAFLASYISSH